MTAFAARLLKWFDVHGRHDLPWQHPRDAYRVWISEVMLQQTQVATVIPYFERFMTRFPDVATLAAAPLDEVLKHWAGLGYYARARNLHRAAQQVMSDHGGEFPRTLDAMHALPGIGRSTAGAILSQSFGLRFAILDGNVRRVLARHAATAGWPGLPKVQARLWDVADALLPQARLADYTQALMDLGNSVCRARAPLCTVCPVSMDCEARLTDRVAEFPSPKPARVRPRRAAFALLITDPEGRILLGRRPPVGIWGGLWALPMTQPDEDWHALTLAMDAQVAGAQLLPAIHHAFTHFDLDLTPVRVAAGEAPATGLRENDERMWIKLSAPQDWPGLPAPIRKLLDGLGAPATLPLFHEHEHRTDSTPWPHAPSTASSSTRKPKASTGRRTPARSASASSKASPRKPGSSGSSTRRG